MSAEFAPRTHLATRVANILLFPPILVGLVPILLDDFSVLASEAFGGLRHFIVKVFGVFFFATNIYVFILHWLLWISFIPIKKSTCNSSLLVIFALRGTVQRFLVIMYHTNRIFCC